MSRRLRSARVGSPLTNWMIQKTRDSPDDDIHTSAIAMFAGEEEALMAVGAVATATEVVFEKYMPHFRPFLSLGLSNYEEHAVCQVAVRGLRDGCRSAGEHLGIPGLRPRQLDGACARLFARAVAGATAGAVAAFE